jgi:hypothetical protein
MMLLYVYADILSLFRPRPDRRDRERQIGPFDVSQSSLVIASVIVILPAPMIALSLTLRASINRPAISHSACCSCSSTSATSSARAGSTTSWFGLLEIALTLTIVATAWNWPRRDSAAAAA